MNDRRVWLAAPVLALSLAAVHARLAAAQPLGAATRGPAAAGPLLRAVMETPRNNAEDDARAVFALLDLGRPGLASQVLADLIARDLDDGAKAELVRTFGSARLVRLTRAEGLGPEASQFATACLAAARASATDPARLAALVERLGSESAAERGSALNALSRTGRDGVRYCLQQMTEAPPKTRNRLRSALLRLAPLSRDALVAMLDSPDGGLRKQAAWALGRLGDRRALPLLAAQADSEPAGSPAARSAQWAVMEITGKPASGEFARRLLDGALADVRRGVPPATPDGGGDIAVYWRNAGAPLAIEPVELPAPQAAVVYAARLARARLAVEPGNPAARRLALVLDLEGRSYLEPDGVTPPTYSELVLTGFSTGELSDALSLSLDNRYAGAAAAIAVALGDRGDASMLVTGGGRPSPLAEALAAPHPAVRFAALRAVMGLQPESPFPGASRVAGALVGFAEAGASRVAVVATPTTQRSATLGGWLAGVGIEALITNNGGEAVRLADNSDLEMVLLDLAILNPNARETLFRLRRRPASGQAPVALLAPAGRLDQAKAIAREHRGVVAFPRPQNAASLAALTDALATRTPVGWPTAAERAELAAVSRGWIGDLLRATPGQGPRFYNLRGQGERLQAALVRGGFTAAAVDALALLGTPGSQQELLTAAGLATMPIDTRRAAAAAFAASAKRFGTLLTTTEVRRQYDRYNASEAADAETQAVLGSVLDAIEGK